MERAVRARAAIYVLIASAMLLPVFTAPVALALGLVFALTLGNPAPKRLQRGSSLLLKCCVVGLGFGLPLEAVLAGGIRGLWVTGVGVLAVLLAGLLLARLFRLDRDSGRLISVGTAICGGSAIAAVGPVIGASPAALSMSMATVFVLNAAALYLFPLIAHVLELSQSQFALWTAIAIHDTSSVVGAAASYGDQALAEATVLKLARTLWIVPLVLGFLLVARRENGATGEITWPVFVGLFVLAAAARSAMPSLQPVFDNAVWVARRGLVLVLFLIGSGLTVDLMRQIGWRPLVFALVLWGLVSSLTLAVILLGPALVA